MKNKEEKIKQKAKYHNPKWKTLGMQHEMTKHQGQRDKFIIELSG